MIVDRPPGTGPHAVTGGRWRRGGVAIISMTRPENVAAGAAVTLLGAYLAGGADAVGSARAVAAAAVVALILGFGNVINDYFDRSVDAVRKAYRPLPSGAVSPSTAAWAAAALAAGAVGVAAGLGGRCAVVAIGATALSWAYSARVKATVLAGNVVVGSLTAATVVFGALAVGGVDAAAWSAAGLILLYFVAFEILKAVEDRVDDASGGIRTIATAWGERRALAAFHAASGAVAVGCAAVALAGTGSAAFAPAALVGTLVPLAVANALARRRGPSLLQSIWVAKAGWFASLPVIALLR